MARPFHAGTRLPACDPSTRAWGRLWRGPHDDSPARYLPGVVGTAGRFPVDVPVATPLVLAGHRIVTPGPLRLYTCGITPYDVTHVGHASTFVWADLIASLAHATGVEAVQCRRP